MTSVVNRMQLYESFVDGELSDSVPFGPPKARFGLQTIRDGESGHWATSLKARMLPVRCARGISPRNVLRV